MISTATMYWGAVLASQSGLAVAAGWSDLDYGDIALPDFNAAYQALLAGLQRERVKPALLGELAFDLQQFQDTPTAQRDKVIRAALATRGALLRDRISPPLYRRAAPFAQPEQAADRLRGALRARTLPLPTPVAVAPPPPPATQKQNHHPQLPTVSAQTIIDAIRTEDPVIHNKIRKKLSVSNLVKRLTALAEASYKRERALSQRVLLYMIQGLETTLWRSFKRDLEKLVYRVEGAFTREQMRALRRLDQENTFGEIRELARHLLTILEKRRGTVARRKLGIRENGPS